MSEYIVRKAALSVFGDIHPLDYNAQACFFQIKAIPAADVRPVKPGKWTKCIVATDNLYDERGMIENMKGYVCDSCREFSIARYNYCPNCGAEMSQEGDV